MIKKTLSCLYSDRGIRGTRPGEWRSDGCWGAWGFRRRAPPQWGPAPVLERCLCAISTLSALLTDGLRSRLQENRMYSAQFQILEKEWISLYCVVWSTRTRGSERWRHRVGRALLCAHGAQYSFGERLFELLDPPIALSGRWGSHTVRHVIAHIEASIPNFNALNLQNAN